MGTALGGSEAREVGIQGRAAGAEGVLLVRGGPGGGTPGRGVREGRQVNSVQPLLAGLGGEGAPREGGCLSGGWVGGSRGPARRLEGRSQGLSQFTGDAGRKQTPSPGPCLPLTGLP